MSKLDNAFGIENSPVTVVGDIVDNNGQVVTPQHSSINENIEYDYEKTRSNLHALLSQGQDALVHALEVAKQSEHPRAFEVVGGLMKQLSDINHQLLDLSEKRQKMIESPKIKDTNQVTNNNAIFVGSTAELNKVLQQLTE